MYILYQANINVWGQSLLQNTKIDVIVSDKVVLVQEKRSTSDDFSFQNEGNDIIEQEGRM